MWHGPIKSSRGSTIVYTIVAMIVLVGMASLSVDLARVQLVKGELRVAADAAARYAVKGLSDNSYSSKAIAAAASNTADGTAVVVTSSDVEIGNWNSTTEVFTVNGAPINSVRVTAKRVASRSTAVPLVFGTLVGMPRCDVSASGIALATTLSPSGFIGLTGVTFKNNTYIASYNSSSLTTPTSATASTNAGLGSNGDIDPKNNSNFYGTVMLGPTGTISGLNGSYTTTHLSAAIATPADPAWSPTTNPNNIAQSYTCNSNTTLPGGTYWFTSLSVSSNLSFSGSATLYVNGNISVSGSVTAYATKPPNLTIYQLGANRTFTGGGTVVAAIVAPRSDFDAQNGATMYGSWIFDTFTTKNNTNLYYDEALGPATGGSVVSLVK